LSGCAATRAVVPKPDVPLTAKEARPWVPLYINSGGRMQATRCTDEAVCMKAARVMHRSICRGPGRYSEVWIAHVWLRGTERWSRSAEAFVGRDLCEAHSQRLRAAGRIAVCERL
jgi:hypothetical protein